jgi:hypothetical protein
LQALGEISRGGYAVEHLDLHQMVSQATLRKSELPGSPL